MSIVRTSAKGQVVIPADIRRRIGLEPGDRVQISAAGPDMVLVQRVPDDPVAAARGLLRDGPSLTEALRKERALERRREDDKGAGFVRHPGVPER